MSLKEMFKAQTSNPENKGYTTFPDTVRPSINPDLIPDGLKPSKPVFPRNTVPFIPGSNIPDLGSSGISADTLPQRIYPTEPDILPDSADTFPSGIEPNVEGPGKRRPWSVYEMLADQNLACLSEGLADDNPALRQAFYVELYKQLEAEKQALENGTSDRDVNSRETDDMQSAADIMNDNKDLTIDTYGDYAKAVAGAVVNSSIDKEQAMGVLQAMQDQIADELGLETKPDKQNENGGLILPDSEISSDTVIDPEIKPSLFKAVSGITDRMQGLTKENIFRETMADAIAPSADGEDIGPELV